MKVHRLFRQYSFCLFVLLMIGVPIINAANVVTGKLNDTGITVCGNKTANNAHCPAAGYLRQDADFGRDKTRNDNKDGAAGFSFTKLNGAGKPLPVTAGNWFCVKDNVTGLIWESKTDDNRLHDVDWSYTWYEPDNRKNGGNAGTKNGGDCNNTSVCDTNGYVKAVNAAGWCGALDWRLPTREELRSIVNYQRTEPSIDTAYFPDTWSKEYWSSTPHSIDSNNAWFINFKGGSHYMFTKYYSYQVRLVRGTQ